MKIKICGITKEKEAGYLRGVDFAGFVLFFEKSKRNISLRQAEKIIKKLDKDIKRVAVVVEPNIEQINAIDAGSFDYVQLHGRISQDLIREIKTPILKAFNVSDINDFEKYRHCEKIKGYVFDSQVPGSGRTFSWSMLKNIPKDNKLFMIAGGLNPENVKEVINFEGFRADAVDVSSGVEDEYGKNEEKIRLFVKAVRGVQ